MLHHVIRSFLPGRHKKADPQASRYSEADLAAIPRYPPFNEGLPCAPVDAVLQTQQELLARIRMLIGTTDEQYEAIVSPIILRYAQFVHLLPASEAHHHRGAGGLLRHGLEVGLWAAQFSLSQIFPFDGAPRFKRGHEQRWLLAAFLAGLAHDLGKPLSDIEVTTAQGEVWSPYIDSLSQWAERLDAERYFVRWRRDRVHKRHEEFTLTILKDIAGRECMQYLSEYDSQLLPSLFRAVGGTTASGTLAKLVMRADQESVMRDLQNIRLDPNEVSYGEAAEKYLFDAMRSLVRSGTWKVNEAGGAVWVLQEGVFIAWQSVMGSLRKALDDLGAKGIPNEPGKIADLLIERGYALERQCITEDGEVLQYRYWPIKAPVATDAMSGEISLLALRLESAKLIFGGEVPAAKEGAYIDEGGQGATADSAPKPTDQSPTPESTQASEAPASAPVPASPTPAPAASASSATDDNSVVGQQAPDANGQGAEDSTGDEGQGGGGLPSDFPDLVQALMATEPAPPPLKLAPQPPDETDDDEGSSALPKGRPLTGADQRDDAEGQAPANDVSAPEQASDAGDLPSRGKRGPKRRRSDKPPAGPMNADILGAGISDTQAAAFHPLNGASSIDDGIPLPMPAQATSAPRKTARRKRGKTKDEPQTIEAILESYGPAGGEVLQMLQPVLRGDGRLGERIDRQSGLFRVRIEAFESDEAFEQWFEQAQDSGLVAVDGAPDTVEDLVAIVLCDAAQKAIKQAVDELERSLDPFGEQASDSAEAIGPAHEPDETADRRAAACGARRAAAVHAHSVSAEPSESLPPDPMPLDDDAGMMPQSCAATDSSGQTESVAAAIQDVLKSVEPKPAITTRQALDQLAQMLAEGMGPWLVDPKAEGDLITIDMSRSFDRIVAHAQCRFSKAALRVALNSHRKLARRNGRIWLRT